MPARAPLAGTASPPRRSTSCPTTPPTFIAALECCGWPAGWRRPSTSPCSPRPVPPPRSTSSSAGRRHDRHRHGGLQTAARRLARTDARISRSPSPAPRPNARWTGGCSAPSGASGGGRPRRGTRGPEARPRGLPRRPRARDTTSRRTDLETARALPRRIDSAPSTTPIACVARCGGVGRRLPRSRSRRPEHRAPRGSALVVGVSDDAWDDRRHDLGDRLLSRKKRLGRRRGGGDRRGDGCHPVRRVQCRGRESSSPRSSSPDQPAAAVDPGRCDTDLEPRLRKPTAAPCADNPFMVGIHRGSPNRGRSQ